MRRDRKDQLDLADIGREANSATLGPKMGLPIKEPKRHQLKEPKRHQSRSPHGRSLDNLVGTGEDRRRNGEAERLGRPEIDHQLEFRRLLDRQVPGFGSL